MPELPEVETVRRDLAAAVRGKKIVAVQVNRAQVIRQPDVRRFVKGLAGVTITGVLRRGKLLVLELSNGKALTVHLKMTGQLVYPGDARTSRVSFRFSDGTWLDFNDQRVFGEVRLLDDWHMLPLVRSFGPEPLEMSREQFAGLFAGRSTRIKPLLLDQKVIAGIGNLYAAEILFRCGIDPRRWAGSLSTAEIGRMYTATRAVLAAAIKHGGSSVDDYVRVSGKPGAYVPYHKVYARSGKPCLKCRTTIERISQGGRGTYFCPACQR